jgi:hypothetical protein
VGRTAALRVSQVSTRAASHLKALLAIRKPYPVRTRSVELGPTRVYLRGQGQFASGLFCNFLFFLTHAEIGDAYARACIVRPLSQHIDIHPQPERGSEDEPPIDIGGGAKVVTCIEHPLFIKKLVTHVIWNSCLTGNGTVAATRGAVNAGKTRVVRP